MPATLASGVGHLAAAEAAARFSALVVVALAGRTLSNPDLDAGAGAELGARGAAAALTASSLVHAVLAVSAVRRLIGGSGLLRATIPAGVGALLLLGWLGLSGGPLVVDLAVGAVLYAGAWTAVCRSTGPELLKRLLDLLRHCVPARWR